MNPPQELKNLLDSCQDTLVWAGSMRQYLKDLADSVGNLNLVEDKANKERIFKKNIYHDLRYALRCARQVSRHYSRVKEALEKLKPVVGTVLRKRIGEIEGRIRPNEAAVIARGSFFRGRLNDTLAALEVRVKREVLTREDVARVVKAIRELIAEDMRSVGLVPFMAGVQNLQTLMEGVQREARRMVA